MADYTESVGGSFEATGFSEEIRVASGVLGLSGLNNPMGKKVELQVRVADEWFVFAEYTSDQIVTFDFKAQVGVRCECTAYQIDPMNPGSITYAIEGMHHPIGQET